MLQILLKIICYNFNIFSPWEIILINKVHQVHLKDDLQWLPLFHLLGYFVNHYLKQYNQNQNNLIIQHQQIQNLLNVHFVLKLVYRVFMNNFFATLNKDFLKLSFIYIWEFFSISFWISIIYTLIYKIICSLWLQNSDKIFLKISKTYDKI